MQNYKYKSRDSVGNVYSGIKEAVSEEDIILWQKDHGLIVCDIKEVRSGISGRTLSSSALHEFCQELSVMLNSGIPIVKALDITSKSRSANRRLVSICKELSNLLRQGMSLSEALKAQGDAFPGLVINVVYSGEISGKMDMVVKQLADYYEKDMVIKQTISKATIYPKFLLVLTLGISLLLFTFVLPNIFGSSIFDGAKLPGITLLMMNISKFITGSWAILLAGTMVMIWSVIFVTRIPAVKLFIDTMLLSLPKIGAILKTIYTARFSITLSYLYGSGVPIVTSVSAASGTMTNLYIRKQFDTVIEKINQGVMLSTAVQNLSCINPRLYHVLTIGEETGRLDDVLAAMANTFDREVDASVSKLIVLISPVILVIMSLVVGVVMISVLLPIFTMYSNISR